MNILLRHPLRNFCCSNNCSRLFLCLATGISLCFFGCQSVYDVSADHQETRNKMIRETAMSYSTQYGLHWESQYINRYIDRNARILDGVFDFRALLLPNSVIPPVLVESHGNVSMNDSQTIRMSDRDIKIVRRSRFSSSIPSWRDYLYMNYPMPDYPDPKLLPTNQAERRAWDEGLVAGWRVGRWQATSIFQVNLGTLRRDFSGMILYYKLLSQGMISPTHSAIAKLGITGDAKNMQLNDRVVRITTESQLTPKNSEQWIPAVPN